MLYRCLLKMLELSWDASDYFPRNESEDDTARASDSGTPLGTTINVILLFAGSAGLSWMRGN